MKWIQSKGLRRLIAIMLINILSIPSVDAKAANKTYLDIKGHKYETALTFAVENGLLTSNTKKINANTVITRGAVLYAVNSLLGATKPYEEMASINNMRKDDVYYRTVSVALKAGYISRREDNTVYLPNAKASRNYIANVLFKAFGVDKSKVLGKKSANSYMTRGEFAALMMKYFPNIINQSTSKITKGNVVVSRPGIVLSNMTIKGDLIIGDGVAKGNLGLNNTIITGKVIVRGGGENSIKIYGGTSIQNLIVKQIHHKVSIKISKDSLVRSVYLKDSCNDVNIIGNVDQLFVDGDDLNISANDGTIREVQMKGKKNLLSIYSQSTVGTIRIDQAASDGKVYVEGKINKVESDALRISINMNDNAIVQTVISNGDEAVIYGNGILKQAMIYGNRNKINTLYTEVTFGDNTTETTIDQRSTPTPASTPTISVIPVIPFVPQPAETPTQVPTSVPTQAPTDVPTEVPTQAPTDVPTEAPTQVPTSIPTVTPEQPNTLQISFRGKTITYGENKNSVISKLGEPVRTDVTEYSFDFMIYSDDYMKFAMIAIKDDQVVGWYTDAIDFNWHGLTTSSDLEEINSKFDKSYTANKKQIVYDQDMQITFFMDLLEGSTEEEGTIDGILVIPSLENKRTVTDDIVLAWEYEILDLTNSFRARNNQSSLEWSETAATVARLHSKDMMENNYFSHIGLDGSTPGTRMQAQGVITMGYGENIIGGYGNAINSSNGWMNSEGHRENMLIDYYKYLGVGYALGGYYANYATQNFYR